MILEEGVCLRLYGVKNSHFTVYENDKICVYDFTKMIETAFTVYENGQCRFLLYCACMHLQKCSILQLQQSVRETKKDSV